jgi:hypothetical protein
MGTRPTRSEATLAIRLPDRLLPARDRRSNLPGDVGLDYTGLGGRSIRTFEVTDDGSGFDPARTPLRTGLQDEDRLEALGGTFGIDSSPGVGTTVRGSITAVALFDDPTTLSP